MVPERLAWSARYLVLGISAVRIAHLLYQGVSIWKNPPRAYSDSSSYAQFLVDESMLRGLRITTPAIGSSRSNCRGDWSFNSGAKDTRRKGRKNITNTDVMDFAGHMSLISGTMV